MNYFFLVHSSEKKKIEEKYEKKDESFHIIKWLVLGLHFWLNGPKGIANEAFG